MDIVQVTDLISCKIKILSYLNLHGDFKRKGNCIRSCIGSTGVKNKGEYITTIYNVTIEPTKEKDSFAITWETPSPFHVIHLKDKIGLALYFHKSLCQEGGYLNSPPNIKRIIMKDSTVGVNLVFTRILPSDILRKILKAGDHKDRPYLCAFSRNILYIGGEFRSGYV